MKVLMSYRDLLNNKPHRSILTVSKLPEVFYFLSKSRYYCRLTYGCFFIAELFLLLHSAPWHSTLENDGSPGIWSQNDVFFFSTFACEISLECNRNVHSNRCKINLITFTDKKKLLTQKYQ